MTMNKHAMFINYILSQRFLLNFNVTRSSIGALSHQALQRCGCCSGTHQKSFIVLLESRFFFVFGYLGVWGNLRRQQKTLIFFCAFGGLGVWGNFFWVNFRRHPVGVGRLISGTVPRGRHHPVQRATAAAGTYLLLPT